MWHVLFHILSNPSSGWREASETSIKESDLFLHAIVPLSLAAPAIFLLLILQPDFYMPIWIGIICCIFIFGINLTLTHIFAVIYEQLANAMNGNCTRSQALLLATSFLSPWFILLALFPIIGVTALLGFFWGSFVFARGVLILKIVAKELYLKYVAASIFLSIVILLMANFFFVGVMSIFAGG